MKSSSSSPRLVSRHASLIARLTTGLQFALQMLARRNSEGRHDLHLGA